MKTSVIGDITWYTQNSSMPWVICINQLEQANDIAEYTAFNVVHIANGSVSDFLKVLVKSEKAKQYIYVIGTELNSDDAPTTKDGAMFQQKLETFFKAYKITYYTHTMLKDESIEKEFVECCKQFYQQAC